MVIPDKTVRSRVNIRFKVQGGDPAEEAFLKEAAALGLTGLRGHRTLGGKDSTGKQLQLCSSRGYTEACQLYRRFRVVAGVFDSRMTIFRPTREKRARCSRVDLQNLPFSLHPG